jgi:hypothetical protein
VLVMIIAILAILGWSLDRVARLASRAAAQDFPPRNRQEVTWPDSCPTPSATSSARSKA